MNVRMLTQTTICQNADMKQYRDANGIVGYQLKRAQSALRSTMDDRLRPFGLTTPQYSCLKALSLNPGASNPDLARDVFVTRQTMNTLLRSLVERGLVKRANKATTGRILPTALTEEGAALLLRAEEEVMRVEQQMVSTLTDAQIDALHEALSQCADALAE